MAEHISGVELRQRGLDLKGNAQGRTLDSYSADGTVAAEYGTEAGYFKTLAKPKSDVAHVRDLLPTDVDLDQEGAHGSPWSPEEHRTI